MIKYGLQEEQITSIQNILAQHQEVEQAILYGSRAKGNFKPASDIDLVLKGEKLNLTILNKIANELDDLLLPYIFDLSVFHQISNEELVEHIERVGVEFYEMRLDSWTEKSLDNLIDALIDYRGKTPVKTFSGIPLVTAKIVKDGFIREPNEFIAIDNYDSWMTRGLPEIGDVVLTTEAPLGEVAQIKNSNIALAQRIVTLRGKKGVLDNGYLKYFLQSDVGQQRLKERETGSTVSGIKQSELRKVLITFPGIIQQLKISSILSSLDDKIELNRQTNQTLEEIAKTLFQEMCVPKGDELPEGWRVGKLGDFIDVNPKLQLKKGSQSKYVEMKDLSENVSSIKNYIDREFSSGSKFQNGDILMARITPCLENGKTGIVSLLENEETGWGSTEFIVLRGKKAISTSFVYCLARSDSFRDFAIKSMVGSSGRQRVAEPTLVQFPLAVPPDPILESFSLVTEGLFQQIYCNHNQNLSLTALRDNLLPKLMKGEIPI